MRKITVEGIEINFNDLTKQKQKELYEKNNNKYKKDASKSIYSEIRKMVAKNETESSKLLNIMLRDELNGKNNIDVIDEIFSNEIFEIEQESIIALATSEYWRYRKKAAKLSKDSSFLNQMLRDEVNYHQAGEVESAIFDNEVFEIEEETIKVLASSGYSVYRVKAAELSKDSNFLNKMYRNEIKGDNDDDVFDAIDNNVIFEIEQETLEVLAASDRWENRQKAAELSKDSKFLNEMYRNEIKGDNDVDVFDAINDNTIFEMEKETLEALAASELGGNRQEAAELLEDSDELLKMFITELQSNCVDEDVLVTIIENEAFVFEKTALLEYIHNNYN